LPEFPILETPVKIFLTIGLFVVYSYVNKGE